MTEALQRVEKVLQYRLPIKIEPQKEGGYFAFSPVWQDCYAQGETIEEVVSEINLVAQTLIEICQEEDLKIPLRVHHPAKLVQEVIDIPVFVTA